MPPLPHLLALLLTVAFAIVCCFARMALAMQSSDAAWDRFLYYGR